MDGNTDCTPRPNCRGHLSRLAVQVREHRSRICTYVPHGKTRFLPWAGAQTAHLAQIMEDTSRTPQCRHFCGPNHRKSVGGSTDCTSRKAHRGHISHVSAWPLLWLKSPALPAVSLVQLLEATGGSYLPRALYSARGKPASSRLQSDFAPKSD